MSLDPSQLTLPQIAAAVAAGQLRLADAEGEFRRRPDPDLPLWQVRSRAAAPRVPPPTASEVMRALDRTRSELRKATRNLEHLAERFESLVQMATRLRPEPAGDSPGSARRPPRPHRARKPGRRAASPTDEAALDPAAHEEESERMPGHVAA